MATMSGTAAFTSGTVEILGGAVAGKTEEAQKGAQAVDDFGTASGLVTGVVTVGNQTAANLASTIEAVATIPGSIGGKAGKAAATALASDSTRQTIQNVKNITVPPPPPSSPPPPPPAATKAIQPPGKSQQ